MMHQSVEILTQNFGLGVALDIVRRWGGRDWQVPVKVNEGSPLALTLGLQTATRIVELLGGQRMKLPDERHALLDARNEAIRRECLENGRSQQSVALEFGLTRQSVKLVLLKTGRATTTTTTTGADHGEARP